MRAVLSKLPATAHARSASLASMAASRMGDAITSELSSKGSSKHNAPRQRQHRQTHLVRRAHHKHKKEDAANERAAIDGDVVGVDGVAAERTARPAHKSRRPRATRGVLDQRAPATDRGSLYVSKATAATVRRANRNADTNLLVVTPTLRDRSRVPQTGGTNPRNIAKRPTRASQPNSSARAANRPQRQAMSTRTTRCGAPAPRRRVDLGGAARRAGTNKPSVTADPHARGSATISSRHPLASRLAFEHFVQQTFRGLFQ